MTEITLAEENDIKNIADIERDIAEVPWSEKQFRDELSLSHARLFCAKRCGEAVGFLDLHIAADDAHINELGVAAEHRRLGTGESLVCAAVEQAKKEGCTVVSLEVRESNRAAEALYEKCGFKKVGVRKRFYHDPAEDGIIMLKEIQQ